MKFGFTSPSSRKRGRRFLLADKLRIALFSDDLRPPPHPIHPPYFRQTGSIQLWNHCQENKGPHCNGHLANPNFAIQVLPLEIDTNVKCNAQMDTNINDIHWAKLGHQIVGRTMEKTKPLDGSDLLLVTRWQIALSPRFRQELEIADQDLPKMAKEPGIIEKSIHHSGRIEEAHF